MAGGWNVCFGGLMRGWLKQFWGDVIRLNVGGFGDSDPNAPFENFWKLFLLEISGLEKLNWEFPPKTQPHPFVLSGHWPDGLNLEVLSGWG